MLVSEGVLKWAINFYPPLFFQRIRVVEFEKGYRAARVKISKSFLNKNYNNAIFGGTMFSAADPLYPVLFSQLLVRKGYQIRAWSRSAGIRFLKPCKTDMYFEIRISDEQLAACENQLKSTGKSRKSYPIEIFDKNKQLCVVAIIEVYVRDLNFLVNGEQ
jgi:acyl-coenzyme A thioesterase PaaI-like protein